MDQRVLFMLAGERHKKNEVSTYEIGGSGTMSNSVGGLCRGSSQRIDKMILYRSSTFDDLSSADEWIGRKTEQDTALGTGRIVTGLPQVMAAKTARNTRQRVSVPS